MLSPMDADRIRALEDKVDHLSAQVVELSTLVRERLRTEQLQAEQRERESAAMFRVVHGDAAAPGLLVRVDRVEQKLEQGKRRAAVWASIAAAVAGAIATAAGAIFRL